MSDRRVVTLTRTVKTAVGTFGELDTGTFKCASLERPPEDLIADHPCIPAGEYDVNWTDVHPHHNPCYEVMNVPGRTAILIHSANVFEQLLGCVAPGAKVERVELDWEGIHVNHMGVTSSKTTLAALIADLKQQPFRLVIKEQLA